MYYSELFTFRFWFIYFAGVIFINKKPIFNRNHFTDFYESDLAFNEYLKEVLSDEFIY